MGWLDELIEGDNVIAKTNHNPARLDNVVRITKTQIILSHNRKFSRKNGWMIGRSVWNMSHITEATPEIISKLKEVENRNGLLEKMSSETLKSLSTPALEMISAIINKETGK